MGEIKWIKITTDVFDDEKILLIESLPEADSIIVIWFKLLCLAGKQNNSGVFLLGDKIAYTDKMLATIFRRRESTVQLALQTFEQFGMIELIDGVITIPNWNKHQTLDSYEKKKERDRQYQRKRREEQKKIAYKSSDSQKTPSSYVAVSDKEEDKDIDKDNIINNITSNIIYSPEPTATEDKSGILIQLNDKTFYDVPLEKIALWKDTYPAVDVEQELKRMAAWCDSNPTRRKTKTGITRFINNWLSKEQDKGGVYRNGSRQQAAVTPVRSGSQDFFDNLYSKLTPTTDGPFQ